MSNIAKIITITPLHKPQVPQSPSPIHGVPIAPRNIPEDFIHPDTFKSFLVIEPKASETDLWTRFSNPEGFFDEDGYYYPPIDPPMDPQELKQFAEKYFLPACDSSCLDSGRSSYTAGLESIQQDSTSLHSLFGGYDSPPDSPEELEQFFSTLESKWPAHLSGPSDAEASSLNIGLLSTESVTETTITTTPIMIMDILS